MTSTITFIPGRTTGSRNVIGYPQRLQIIYLPGQERDEKTYWRCTDKTLEADTVRPLFCEPLSKLNCQRASLAMMARIALTKVNRHPAASRLIEDLFLTPDCVSYCVLNPTDVSSQLLLEIRRVSNVTEVNTHDKIIDKCQCLDFQFYSA